MVLGLTYISQQSCAVKIFRRQIVTRKRKKQIPLKYSRKQYQKVQFSQTNNYLAFSFYDGKNYLNSPFWKLSWNNIILKIIWEKKHCESSCELLRQRNMEFSPLPTTQVYRPSWSRSTLSMMWVWGSPLLALWNRNLNFNFSHF